MSTDGYDSEDDDSSASMRRLMSIMKRTVKEAFSNQMGAIHERVLADTTDSGCEQTEVMDK